MIYKVYTIDEQKEKVIYKKILNVIEIVLNIVLIVCLVKSIKDKRES